MVTPRFPQRPHRDSPCAAEGPERSSSHEGPPQEARELSAHAQDALARAQAHCPVPASIALPGLGESGRPLTAPTKRHWKSFRTSSQLCTPSLRVNTTRARRRRQQQPKVQVGLSIIDVPTTPFPTVDPTLPALPALKAPEKARRSWPPRDAIWLWAFRDRSEIPGAPAST